MADIKIYEALADAFIAEEVDTLFVLTGDGNMHWEAAFSRRPGTRSYHVRHEHCACAMATAYSVATNKVGVASVTCGPGLTQIMTALTTAARARIPLVVFAGETPMNSSWYNQHIDQGPLVTGTGARYVSIQSPKRIKGLVRDAFHFARTQRLPVVIAVPLDLQQQLISELPAYEPSTALIPDVGPMAPNPAYLEKAVDHIAAAQRVVIIGGRGVMFSDARVECVALADLCGAFLAQTLPVRGLFDHNTWSIGVVGGFAHEAARKVLGDADLILAVGASLTHHTKDGGKLFPQAHVIQIDEEPTGFNQGSKVADTYVRGDAKLTVQSIIASLQKRGKTPGSGWRTRERLESLAGPADSELVTIAADLLDPRAVVAALDQAIPKDWEIVNSSGHCSYFSAQMRGRSADNFLAIREFGAIGNGLSYATGVAVAKPTRPVALIDGDGGFLMHVQELETIRRHGLKVLFCILNDGAFGSEIHKLRADGLDDHGAIFGRGDLGQVARGFGLRGEVITDLAQLPAKLEAFIASDCSEVWDFHVSDAVTSPVMRAMTSGKPK